MYNALQVYKITVRLLVRPFVTRSKRAQATYITSMYVAGCYITIRQKL